MWTFFGIVQLIRPESTGRVGKIMLTEIQDLIMPCLDEASIKEETGFVGELSDSIHEWSLLGAKIDHFCATFGPGIIFWAGSALSRNL